MATELSEERLDGVLEYLARNQGEIPLTPLQIDQRAKLALPRHEAYMICAKLAKDGLLHRGGDGITVNYVITYDGIQFISDGGYARQKQLREADLAERREMHQSVTDTNRFQRSFGKWTLTLTGLSIFFIAISAVLQYQDKTSKEVQLLRDTLQRSLNKTDSIVLSLKEINQTIQKISSDSTKK